MGAAALATVPLPTGEVVLRRAELTDVPAIVALLADDPLGRNREVGSAATDLSAYRAAFTAVDADLAHLLVVAVADDEVVGTLQLSFLPGLSRRGALRAQIEAVRVGPPYRSRELGRAMVGWAVGEARRRGCALVQLTSDQSRTDAHRFYSRLGFVASHVGFKLEL